MANIKITDLTAYGDPTSTDVLPIVDVGADVTKKVSVADLLENAGSGTASAPGIAFDGDSNTGIYRPGADQLAISTNGVGRLFVDESGNVGLGTSSPSSTLHVAGTGRFNLNGTNNLVFTTESGAPYIQSEQNAALHFGTNSQIRATINSSGNVGIGDTGPSETLTVKGASSVDPLSVSGPSSEFLRVDDNGRLLVGTSTSVSNLLQGSLQVVGTAEDSYITATRYSPISAAPAGIVLGRSKSGTKGTNALVANGDGLGAVSFSGADGTKFINAAEILALVDGTPGADDMPGRLVFSVTADGSASPTEALRITNDRYVRLASGTGGIQFNGDTAAANTLDDYEEGTWTPAITGTSGGTYTPGATNVGGYVKIGKFVFCSATVHWTAEVTPYSGALIISGLPFNSANIASLRAQGILGAQVSGVYATSPYKRLGVALDPNKNFVYLSEIDDTDTSGDNYNSSPSINSSGTIFGVTVTYRVS